MTILRKKYREEIKQDNPMKNRSLVLILLCVLCLGGCAREPMVEKKKERPVRPVRHHLLKAEKTGKTRTFSGTAVADRKSVLSFKVSGTLRSIHVKVGDKVMAGTLLAELDKTDLLVELESARAGLKTAQADARSAQTAVYTSRSNYDRIQKLYEKDNVSLSEFEKARGDYETAQAQFQASTSRITTEKTKLKAAENQLLYTRLSAPFDGIINHIALDENEEISPGAALFTLSGLGNLEVNINVSELYITSIKTDMGCRVTFPAFPEAVFDGVVTEVPYAVSDAPTYPVTIGIQIRDDRLRPGMAAEVRFRFGMSGSLERLHIPVDGVGEEAGQNFAFVIDTDKKNRRGVVRKRNISIGELTEKGFLVKEGLEPGERIATSGLQILLDGMDVKLLEDPIKEW